MECSKMLQKFISNNLSDDKIEAVFESENFNAYIWLN